MADTDKKNQPDATGVIHDRQSKSVETCRDVFGGTITVRAKDTKYLPPFPKEDQGAYNSRLRASVLFNAFGRTVHGLVGMIMRRPPDTSEVNEEILKFEKNIDLEGTHLDVFIQHRAVDVMVDGHTHVFLDMQSVDPEAAPENLAAENALGLRPYWIGIKKQDVLRFRSEVIGGVTVLTMFAYQEVVNVPDGKYGEKEVTHVRIYNRGVGNVVWEIWEKQEDDAAGNSQWVQIKTGTMAIDEIPLVTIYANKKGYMESDPPLLDLALENILHYQTRSDRHNTLHIAGVPIPVIIGAQSGDNITVGVNHAINLPQGGGAHYLEPTGASLDQSRQELQDIEARMAALGLAMLKRESRAVETAEAKRLDKSEQDSSLAKVGRALQDGFDECLRLHAKWAKIKEPGEISINDDYGDTVIDSATIVAYSAMVAAKQLTLETMWLVLSSAGALPDGFDPAKEKDALDQLAQKALVAFQKQQKATPPAPPVPGQPPKPGQPDSLR